MPAASPDYAPGCNGEGVTLAECIGGKRFHSYYGLRARHSNRLVQGTPACFYRGRQAAGGI